MSTVQEIESAIEDLSSKEKKELHAWFDEHIADHFDAALERGVEVGVFDGLIEDALADYDAGKTRLL